MKKSTKIQIASSVLITSVVLSSKKNRKKLKTATISLGNSIKTTAGIDRKDIQEIIFNTNTMDANVILNNVIKLLAKTDKDISKINFKKIASSIINMTETIESTLLRSKLEINKSTFLSMFGNSATTKVDELISKLHKFKLKMSSIKEPETQNAIDWIRYKLQVELAKKMRKSMKEVTWVKKTKATPKKSVVVKKETKATPKKPVVVKKTKKLLLKNQ